METFVGDTVELQFYTTISLAAYTTLFILYRKPDGTQGFWVATMDPGDNTIATYTTTITDLDQPGIWQMHVYAEDASFRGHGRICELNVLEPLSSRIDETTLAPTTVVPTTI